MSAHWNRREFLKKTSAATLASLAAGAPFTRALAKSQSKIPNTSADTVILLWMAGGMAHTETFDPKKYTPFENGLAASKVLSTFPSLPTSLDGIEFSEGLQGIGSQMHK